MQQKWIRKNAEVTSNLGAIFLYKAFDPCIDRKIFQFENYCYIYLIIPFYHGFWGMSSVIEWGWTSVEVMQGVKVCSRCEGMLLSELAPLLSDRALL